MRRVKEKISCCMSFASVLKGLNGERLWKSHQRSGKFFRIQACSFCGMRALLRLLTLRRRRLFMLEAWSSKFPGAKKYHTNKECRIKEGLLYLMQMGVRNRTNVGMYIRPFWDEARTILNLSRDVKAQKTRFEATRIFFLDPAVIYLLESYFFCSSMALIPASF